MARPDLYDPKINRAYAELVRHYGVLIDPARAYHPTRASQGRASNSEQGRRALSTYLTIAGGLLADPGNC